MTTQEFFTNYLDKSIDFDGMYGAQCFDVYRQYCKEVLEVPQSPATGTSGAKEIWHNYLKEYFDAIPNSPLNSPQLGDIVIWGIGIGPYGHVAICQTGGVISFTSFDQNWAGVQKCVFVKHSYKGVLGWLRRKTPVVQDTLPVASPSAPEPTIPPEPMSTLQEPLTPVSELPTVSDVVSVEPIKLNFFQQLIEWLKKLLGYGKN